MLGENQLKVKEEKLFNYFYKTVNLLNGRYYYGIRSTNVHPNKDSYLGSGKAIKEAIRLYGKEAFKKEVINHYPTRLEASWHEQMIVTDELIKDSQCYNIRTGGENGYIQSLETRLKIKISNTGKKHSEETIQKQREEKRLNPPFKGRKHSEESKQKISIAHIGMKLTIEQRNHLREINLGERNPGFGKKRSIESRQRMSDAQKGNGFGRGKTESEIKKLRENAARNNPCVIFGIFYFSASEAGRHLNLSCNTVNYRIKSSNLIFKDWIFVNDIPYVENTKPSRIKCIIEGVIYESLAEAGRQHGINVGKVHKRINSKSDRFSEWQYFVEGDNLCL